MSVRPVRGLTWHTGAFSEELDRDHNGLAAQIERALDDPATLTALKALKLESLPLVFPSFPTTRKVMEIFLEILKGPLEKELGVPLKPLRNVDLITLSYLEKAYTATPKLPFTRDFIVACAESKAAHERAERWLLCKRGKGWRGWLAITAAVVMSVVMSFVALNPDADPRKVLIANPIITLVGVFIGAALGMIFTGTQPHAASVAANHERTHIDLLIAHFNAAARELIDLYTSAVPQEKELAIRLANAIDPTKMAKDYRLLTLQKEAVGTVLNELEDAIYYIRYAENPSAEKPPLFYMSDMESYIRAAGARMVREPVIDGERMASFAAPPSPEGVVVCG